VLLRGGAMAAEARNNGSANFKEPCAAERVVEAATAPSHHPVARKIKYVCQTENFFIPLHQNL